MNEIDHGYTDEIVCPYCGAKESDSWEVCPGEEDIGNIECGTCEKTFFTQRIITIQYSTYKIDWLDEWKIYNNKKIKDLEFVKDWEKWNQEDNIIKKTNTFLKLPIKC